MKSREVPLSYTLLLIFLLLLGLGINFLAWLDVEFEYHYVLRPPEVNDGNSRGPSREDTPKREVEQLKQSILNVRVQVCGSADQWITGTGFVVKRGYVCTAAHVVQQHQECGREIHLEDHKGLQYSGQLVGYSRELDLAVLSFSGRSLPALKLARSKEYEGINDVVEVVTIGYPLLGEASSTDKASLSSEGNISRFDPTKHVFITAGLNLNPGNSGGPVFVRTTWEVLGIATQKFDVTVGEGLGVVVPSDTFVQFLREKTGEAL